MIFTAKIYKLAFTYHEILLDITLLIISIAFVLDCIFTGAIRKALAPVNDVMINALAVVLVFDSALGVFKGVVA
ncbi:hypothetical protein ACRW0R_24225 [Escherichia coli]|uniref:hypothetical protein n=1 Tax=Escherichia coli TaxID=562 RepID=UPI001621333F|nr:hypothetical protein [Escherichia coli]